MPTRTSLGVGYHPCFFAFYLNAVWFKETVQNLGVAGLSDWISLLWMIQLGCSIKITDCSIRVSQFF